MKVVVGGGGGGWLNGVKNCGMRDSRSPIGDPPV